MSYTWEKELLQLKQAYLYHRETIGHKLKVKDDCVVKNYNQLSFDFNPFKLSSDREDEFELLEADGEFYTYQYQNRLIFLDDESADGGKGFIYQADLSDQYKDVFFFNEGLFHRKITIVYKSDGTVYKHTDKDFHTEDSKSNTKETFYYPENTTVEEILQSK